MIRLTSLFLLALNVSHAWGADSFDSSTGYLTIPLVVVGDGTKTSDTILASDVVITVGDLISSGETYPLSERNLTPKPDFYDTSLNQLIIPQVVVGDSVYEDIVITLGDVVSHTGGSQPWMSPSHSGAESLQPFKYFFADDIPQIVRDRFELAIEAAADYFGRYARTEVYVVGKDEPAMNKLIDSWCINRNADGHTFSKSNSWGDTCSEHHTNPENPARFEFYRQKSLAGFPGAGINGWADLGFHFYVSAYPIYLEGEGQDYGWSNPIHEYFHIAQVAHTARYEQRTTDLMGPIWFWEGSAQFMDKWITEKLQKEGKLPVLGEGPYDFIRGQIWTLKAARAWWAAGNRLPEVRNVSVLDANPPSDDLLLNVGPWTTAYLLHSIDDTRALEDKFYPVLRELGFEGAFEQTFNLTVEEFNTVFDEFMGKSVEEQLSILPGWNDYELKDQAISDAKS